MDTDLRRSDVTTLCDGFLMFLCSSKTDSFCLGNTVCIYPSVHSVCAVGALHRFLAIHEGTLDEPLFRCADGDYLTRRSFTARLHSLLHAAGIEETLYVCHSFRIGAATTAAAGIPPWLIQTLSRWSSDWYRCYIRTSAETLRVSLRNWQPRLAIVLRFGVRLLESFIWVLQAELWRECGGMAT